MVQANWEPTTSAVRHSVFSHVDDADLARFKAVDAAPSNVSIISPNS